MEGGSLKIPTSPVFLLSERVALLYHVRLIRAFMNNHFAVTGNGRKFYRLANVSCRVMDSVIYFILAKPRLKTQI